MKTNIFALLKSDNIHDNILAKDILNTHHTAEYREYIIKRLNKYYMHTTGEYAKYILDSYKRIHIKI